MKYSISFFLIFLMSGICSAQIPQYELTLHNDSVYGGTYYEYDITLRSIDDDPFELAGIECILKFNPDITAGDMTLTVDSSSSDLNISQLPRNSDLSISGGELRMMPRTPPGSGNGTMIGNKGSRVGRFRLASTLPFNTQSADIGWKNAADTSITSTKVYAYVSGIGTDITDSAYHFNNLTSSTLSPLAVFSTSPRPDGTAGVPYHDTLRAVGGTPPYSWTLVSGSLPPGFTLSPAGFITGTYNGTGTFNYTVKLTDSVPDSAGGTFTMTINPGPLDHFQIEAQSGGFIGTQVAGVPFNIKVTALDDYGNTATGFSGTADISSNGILSLGEGTTAAFTAGVLASHSVSITSSRNDITVTAVRTGFSESGMSNSFTVSPSTPERLTIVQQPISGDTAGTVIAPPVIVQVQDSYFNDVPVSGDTVVIALASGTGTLSGTKIKITDPSGSLVYDDLMIEKSGLKTLTVTSPLYLPDTSDSFLLVPGDPVKIGPETAADGSGTIVPPQILGSGNHIGLYAISRDVNDNFVENAGADFWEVVNITDSIKQTDLVPDPAKRQALFTGGLTGSCEIRVGLTGLTSVNSGTLTVIPGDAVKLSFAVQPADGMAGAVISPPVIIRVKDGAGNNVLIEDDTVKIALAGGSGILSGTLQRLTDDSGRAEFGDLSINQPGNKVLRAFNDRYIEAVSDTFGMGAYIITASANPHGSIVPSGSVAVIQGGDQLFSITADTGYHISDVLVDDVSAGAVPTYTFTNVTADHSIESQFAIDTLVITASGGPHGSVSPTGSVKVLYGSDQTFRFMPDTGYRVDSVLVDGVYAGNDTAYTFLNVTSGHTIVARFSPKILSVTVGTNPAGLQFIVDGITYNSAQVFSWIAAESHIITSDSIQSGTPGTRYLWSSWTNAATRTDTVTPLINTIYTAGFNTQFYLTMTANPGGSVVPSGGWYDQGQSIQITAVPDPKFSFNVWSGSGSGSYSGYGNPASVTMNGPVSETASFRPDPVQVTVQTDPPGRSFTYDGDPYIVKQTFSEEPGTLHDISLSTPQPGVSGVRYSWVNWSDGGDIAHTIQPFTDTAFTAHFKTQFQLITVAGPGGNVSPGSGWHDTGSVLSIKASPDIGFIFNGWSGTGIGSYTGALDSVPITMGSPITQTASFTPDTMIITAAAGLHGSIYPSGPVKVVYGADQMFTVIPDTLYNISDVVVDGISVGTVDSYTFEDVIADHSIVASFTINGYTITATAGSHGLISPSGPVPIEHGGSQTFTITADSGYHIDSVFVDGVYIGDPAGYTFENVVSSHTITAKFSANRFVITATSDGNGAIAPEGPVSAAFGGSQSFAFIPNTGFRIESVIVDGVNIGAPASYTFSDIAGDHSIHVTFARFTATVTVQTNPEALTIIVDDTVFTSPRTFYWTTGSHHTIAASDTQQGITGTRFIWNNWNDNGARVHTVMPVGDTTFTADFGTQYFLTTSANLGGSALPPSGWFDRAGVVTLTAVPDAGYYFTAWSGTGFGAYSGPDNPVNVTMNGPMSEIANFSHNPLRITVKTEPPGRSFTYNGQIYTAAQTRTVDWGSVHTIGVSSPQPDTNADKRHIWRSWSDGGGQNHSILPVTDSDFVAFFSEQYALTLSASPPDGGTVVPEGKNFFNYGDTISLSAAANAGYIFTGWSGSATGAENPIKLIINGARTVTANFERAIKFEFTTVPPGRRIVVDDSVASTPSVFFWLGGSEHTLSALSPQSDTAGTQFIWTNWSNGGSVTHIITAEEDDSITAYFGVEHYLSMNAGTGGSVSAIDGWYPEHTALLISATADSQYVFESWSGTGIGSYTGTDNPAEIVMDGAISETASFHTIFPPPVLAGIPDGAEEVSTSPDLSWIRYPGAASYGVQVSTDSLFADPGQFVLDRTGITDTTVQLSSLANLRRYYWRVNAAFGGYTTVYSDARRFTTLNATISVVSPSITWAGGYSYDILWTSDDLSGGVNIEISLDSGKSFTAIVSDTQNSGHAVWSIPGAMIDHRIDSCILRVLSILNNSISDASEIFSIVPGYLPPYVSLSTVIPFPAEPNSSSHYKLFGLPGVLDSLQIGDFLPGNQKTDWRVFADDGNPDDYLVELTKTSALHTGEGYWFLKKGNFEVSGFNMAMPALSGDASYQVPVHKGWNIIGNPFDKTIPWVSVLNASDLPAPTELFGYQGSYISSDSLEPFKGYYFFNAESLTYLKFPYPFGGSAANARELEINWKMQIIFLSDINEDPHNYIGIAPGSKTGMDLLDGRKPPLFLDQGFLYFPRRHWDSKYFRFKSDFRPAVDAGQVWDFEVSNPRKSPGTLVFKDVDRVPPDYHVILINLNNNNPVDIRAVRRYLYQSPAPVMRFKIIVGNDEFINEEISRLTPKSFGLTQNYPNPFNSSTSFAVQLPEQTFIKLMIYNTLGQQTSVIAEGEYQKGIHTFTWNGTGPGGIAAATGVYYCKLMSASFNQTKKILLIK